MKSLKKTLSLWLPVIIWAFIIFMFSARPSVRASRIYWQDFIIKKSAHFIIYAIFSVILYRAFQGSNFNKKKSLYFSFLIAVIYGASDEFHQSFTAGREPTIRDILIDSAGAALAIYFIYKYLPILPEKAKKLLGKFGIF